MRIGSRWTAGTLVAATALAQAPADAQPSVADKTTARALFDAGRELVAQKRYAEACPKLEESQRLDPGVGTMFHLADCWEQAGKTASAWSMFLEAASRLRAERDSAREAAARARVAALEPRLSKLTISVPPASRTPGLTVRRDGADVGPAVWGQPIPVDLGEHRVEASAPGRRAWSTAVNVSKEGERAAVEVPALQDVGSGAETPVPPAPASSTAGAATAATPARAEGARAGAAPSGGGPDGASGAGSGQRTAGLIVAGVGVVALGVGGLLALGAKSKFNDAEPYCQANRCSRQGYDLREEAVSRGDVATIVAGVGGAALLGGGVLFLTAPKGAKEKPSAGAGLVVGPGSVAIRGAW